MFMYVTHYQYLHYFQIFLQTFLTRIVLKQTKDILENDCINIFTQNLIQEIPKNL